MASPLLPSPPGHRAVVGSGSVENWEDRVKRLIDMAVALWQKDPSGNLFWMMFALVVPFGWIALVLRAEPDRLRVLSFRSSRLTRGR
jgi:hypothetical protein